MTDDPRRRFLRALDDEPTPVDAIARGPSAQHVARELGRRVCLGDGAFDRFLPYDARVASGRHWTPLAVVLRVADWIDELGVTSVVDLGSGVGKFCVATALATGCELVGIEQRARFVATSRALANRFGVGQRVTFVEGALGECAIPEADAYYLYNPFGENLFGPEGGLGDDVVLSTARYKRDVGLLETFFALAPLGTVVIKYNGFGGRMPAGYDAIRVDRELPNVLRAWRKTRA